MEEDRQTETLHTKAKTLPGIEIEKAKTIITITDLITDLDAGVIGWESADDSINPLNWSARKKTCLMVLVGSMSTLSPLASSLNAPGISSTMIDLHEDSRVVGSLMITIFLLGYTIGPLFLAPLSEIYGRYPIVVISSWFFVVWLLGCSFAQNMPSLIIMRVLGGVGGSAIMTLAPAIVGDLFPVERRAFGSALIIMAQCLGPIVGPICGGFIAQHLGWRWAYWILAIASGAVMILITIFMNESNSTVILQRKTDRLKIQLARPDLVPRLQLKMNRKELLTKSLVRPLKLLTKSPIVLLLSTYIATIYSFLYILLTTLPTVFEGIYGWPLQFTGLAYIGLGIGMILSLLVAIATNDRTVIALSKKNNGVFEPEMRLPGMMYFAIFVPISLFWAITLIALMPFGFGIVGLFLPAQTYMIDAFPLFAASAVAAPTCMRSLFGAFVPLVGPPLYESLGLGWGNTLLGFIALSMVPIPVLFYRYGGAVRKRWPVQL